MAGGNWSGIVVVIVDGVDVVVVDVVVVDVVVDGITVELANHFFISFLGQQSYV